MRFNDWSAGILPAKPRMRLKKPRYISTLNEWNESHAGGTGVGRQDACAPVGCVADLRRWAEGAAGRALAGAGEYPLAHYGHISGSDQSVAAVGADVEFLERAAKNCLRLEPEHCATKRYQIVDTHGSVQVGIALDPDRARSRGRRIFVVGDRREAECRLQRTIAGRRNKSEREGLVRLVEQFAPNGNRYLSAGLARSKRDGATGGGEILGRKRRDVTRFIDHLALPDQVAGSGDRENERSRPEIAFVANRPRLRNRYEGRRRHGNRRNADHCKEKKDRKISNTHHIQPPLNKLEMNDGEKTRSVSRGLYSNMMKGSIDWNASQAANAADDWSAGIPACQAVSAADGRSVSRTLDNTKTTHAGGAGVAGRMPALQSMSSCLKRNRRADGAACGTLTAACKDPLSEYGDVCRVYESIPAVAVNVELLERACTEKVRFCFKAQHGPPHPHEIIHTDCGVKSGISLDPRSTRARGHITIGIGDPGGHRSVIASYASGRAGYIHKKGLVHFEEKLGDDIHRDHSLSLAGSERIAARTCGVILRSKRRPVTCYVIYYAGRAEIAYSIYAKVERRNAEVAFQAFGAVPVKGDRGYASTRRIIVVNDGLAKIRFSDTAGEVGHLKPKTLIKFENSIARYLDGNIDLTFSGAKIYRPRERRIIGRALGCYVHSTIAECAGAGKVVQASDIKIPFLRTTVALHLVARTRKVDRYGRRSGLSFLDPTEASGQCSNDKQKKRNYSEGSITHHIQPKSDRSRTNDSESCGYLRTIVFECEELGNRQTGAQASCLQAAKAAEDDAGSRVVDNAGVSNAAGIGVAGRDACAPVAGVKFLLPKYVNTFIIPSCFLRLSLISRDISRPVLQAAHFGSAQESSFCGFGSSRFFRVGRAAAVTEQSIRHSGFTCLFASFWTLDTGEMGTKLYVGNLSFRVTSDDLQEHFATAGQVDSANVVMDRETGRSRGFGFVEMASDDDATAAIAQFNGTEYDGRNMVVNEARPREDNRGGGGGYRGGRGGGGGGGGYGGGGGGRDRGNYGDDRGYGGGSRW